MSKFLLGNQPHRPDAIIEKAVKGERRMNKIFIV